MNKHFKAKFHSEEWDQFLAQWLSGQIDSALINEWSHVLMFDNPFRENFCDFIKALREPGWKKKRPEGDAS